MILVNRNFVYETNFIIEKNWVYRKDLLTKNVFKRNIFFEKWFLQKIN